MTAREERGREKKTTQPGCQGTPGMGSFISTCLDSFSDYTFYLFVCLFKDFIYLFMRDIERGRDIGREGGEADSMQEPDAGLDPGTPGS